jgi:hypothetical protein
MDINFQLEDAAVVLYSPPPFSFHGLITLVISVDRQATRIDVEAIAVILWGFALLALLIISFLPLVYFLV